MRFIDPNAVSAYFNANLHRKETPVHAAAPTHKIAYTVDEAAIATGLSRRKLYYLMSDGALPYSQRAGRRLIRADALQALVN